MSDIKWQRGVFHKFVANMKIRVGGAAPLDIQKDDEFEFDGSILKYSGMELAQSQIRGALTSGWARLVGEDESQNVDSVRPNRNIAKSQTVNTDLSRVQRLVNTQISTSNFDEDEVLRVGDRSDSDAKSPKIVTASDSRRGRVVADVGDSQDAVTIGRVRTSAKTTFTDVSKDDVSRKINDLENLSNVKAELFNRTVQKEGVTIKSNVGSINRMDTAQEDEGRVIGSVRKSSHVSTEGLSITDTSNIRNKVASAPVSAPEVTAPVIDRSLPVRIRVARSIDPVFPANWSFEGKLADRLSAVKSEERTVEFIEALYAAEGDQMRRLLSKEYPELLGG